MPISRRLALVSALWMLAPIASAGAQSIPLPREAQIGPRPFYLVDKMKDGPLKTELSQCTGPFHKTDFSVGHRGAALQFPEHSRESYSAAARMGAGVIECDVTFTKDKQGTHLVLEEKGTVDVDHQESYQIWHKMGWSFRILEYLPHGSLGGELAVLQGGGDPPGLQ